MSDMVRDKPTFVDPLRGAEMKVFVLACVTAAVLAAAAVVTLNHVQEPVAQAFVSRTAVRL